MARAADSASGSTSGSRDAKTDRVFARIEQSPMARAAASSSDSRDANSTRGILPVESSYFPNAATEDFGSEDANENTTRNLALLSAMACAAARVSGNTSGI